MVRFSNCWNCSCSHSKSPTIWKLDFLKVPTVFSNQTNFDHSNNGLVWNSEGNCSQENSNTKISLVLYSDLYLTLISKNTIKLALRSRILIPERFKIVGIWKLDISRFWMIDKRLVCKLSWPQIGIWNLGAHLTNSRNFVKTHYKSGQKCPDFNWSNFLWLGLQWGSK